MSISILLKKLGRNRWYCSADRSMCAHIQADQRVLLQIVSSAILRKFVCFDDSVECEVMVILTLEIFCRPCKDVDCVSTNPCKSSACVNGECRTTNINEGLPCGDGPSSSCDGKKERGRNWTKKNLTLYFKNTNSTRHLREWTVYWSCSRWKHAMWNRNWM